MLISHINNHKPSSIILSFTVVLATLAAVLSMPRVAADESERHKIHYLLTPGPPSVPNSMHVTLTIPTLSPNEASSCIELQLPPAIFGIAGVDGPYHNITRDAEVSYGCRVEGGETTSTGGGTWHLCSTRKKEERDVAQFGYTISQGSGGPLQGGGDGPPVDRVKVFSPLFQPDYWTFTSVTGLVVPKLSGAVRVIVAAEAPGSNWKLLSSRGIDLNCERQDNENSRCQISFDVDDATHDLRRLADTQPGAAVGEATVFHFAKNAHIRRFTLPRRSGGPLNSVDNEVIIAITGETDYATIQELQEGTQRIVEGSQAYWGGRPTRLLFHQYHCVSKPRTEQRGWKRNPPRSQRHDPAARHEIRVQHKPCLGGEARVAADQQGRDTELSRTRIQPLLALRQYDGYSCVGAGHRPIRYL